MRSLPSSQLAELSWTWALRKVVKHIFGEGDENTALVEVLKKQIKDLIEINEKLREGKYTGVQNIMQVELVEG